MKKLARYQNKVKRNINLCIAAKRGKETDPEIEAATQSLMGLDSVAASSGMDTVQDTSRLVPGPPIGGSVATGDQGVTTVGQTIVPGEIPAKAVASAQDGSKKKMTFVVPKGQLGVLSLLWLIHTARERDVGQWILGSFPVLGQCGHFCTIY